MSREKIMQECVFCDKHYLLCHNGKCSSFLLKCLGNYKGCKFYISRNRYDQVEKPITKKKDSTIEEIDWSDEMHYVNVYWKKSECFINKHKRINYNAKVYDSFMKQYIYLKIFYCCKCEMYFVNGNLLPEEEILHHIEGIKLLNMPNRFYYGELSYDLLSPKSVLRRQGYSVGENGPTTKERQEILRRIIKKEILSTYEIINHIAGLIEWHQAEEKWENSIKKYKEDLKFLNEYDEKNSLDKFTIKNK